MYNDTSNSETLLLCILICIIGLLLIIAFYINVLLPFIKEREYIIMELNRSDEKEYWYWRRKLKILYLSKIPIIGYIIIKKMNKRKF